MPDPIGTAEGRPALRRCTAVDLRHFADQVWGRHASLSRADALPGDFGDLFSLAAADELLSEHGLRTPFVRVAKDGATLPTSRFTSGGGVGATITDQVDDVRLAHLFGDGATIVLQALHRTHPPVIRFAQQLGADLGHPVQVNAYLTPPANQGFSAHYDVHDVFVLQIAGQKQWRVHPPVHPAPLRDEPWTERRAAVQAAAHQEPLLDVVLQPGDALYLPRGFLHEATALGGTCAHLTVGVHVWTRRHVLEHLLAIAGDVTQLRASLPLGVDVGDPHALQDDIALAVKLLHERLAAVDPGEVAARFADAALTTGRAAPVGPLAQAASLASLTGTDRLRWRAALQVSVRADGERIAVHTADGVVHLPCEASEVISRLRRGEVLSAGEIGLDVARALLRGCLTVMA